jgi:hypothetical protein
MMLMGRTVGHAVFGEGVILGVDRRCMTVRFEVGEKRFVYPDAFDRYLVTRDRDTAEEVARALAAARLARETSERREHRERACLSDKGSVISGYRRVEDPAEDDFETDAE